jgi:hypothetical protein
VQLLTDVSRRSSSGTDHERVGSICLVLNLISLSI